MPPALLELEPGDLVAQFQRQLRRAARRRLGALVEDQGLAGQDLALGADRAQHQALRAAGRRPPRARPPAPRCRPPAAAAGPRARAARIGEDAQRPEPLQRLGEAVAAAASAVWSPATPSLSHTTSAPSSVSWRSSSSAAARSTGQGLGRQLATVCTASAALSRRSGGALGIGRGAEQHDLAVLALRAARRSARAPRCARPSRARPPSRRRPPAPAGRRR